MNKKFTRLFFLMAGLTCFSALNMFVHAQSVSLGVRGGMCYNNMLGIDSSNFKTGYAGGLALQYSSGGKWDYSVDFLFAQRGTKFQNNIKDTLTNQREKFEYDYSFNFLEIPVMFHYNVLNLDSGKLKVRASFGPSLNVRLSANNAIKYTKVVTTADSSITTTSEGDQDLAYTFIPLDYGFVGGIGASYMVTEKVMVSLDIRASYGLLDMREYLSESSKAVHGANVNAFLGVCYRLGK